MTKQHEISETARESEPAASPKRNSVSLFQSLVIKAVSTEHQQCQRQAALSFIVGWTSCVVINAHFEEACVFTAHELEYHNDTAY